MVRIKEKIILLLLFIINIFRYSMHYVFGCFEMKDIFPPEYMSNDN